MDYLSFTHALAFGSLFLTSWLSALSILPLGLSPKPDHPQSILVKAAQSRYFGWLQLAIAASMATAQLGWLQAIAATFALLVALLGTFAGKHCNCLGRFTPASRIAAHALRAWLAICATLILYLNWKAEPQLQPTSSWPVMLFFYLLATIAAIASLAPAQQQTPEPAASNRPTDSLSPGLVLGRYQNTHVRLEEAAIPDKPLMLVFLASDCPHCKRALAYIAKFIHGFGIDFPIVLISNGTKEMPESIANASLPGIYSLEDEKMTVYRHLKAAGTPSAILLHGSTLNLLSPVSHGIGKIRILLSLAANLLDPDD
ncbi:hypothetical protein [Chromobacterium sp. IIBBL 290-4]|uniref:hypothetical protein n=1 Tax=Chromobacterium sp. IIBBL 290-4 TaxID=2953890 RepID=UPI0020B89133|nr:hypothetical protein [Chromobacterium sp. IIBBL 290-4]UTH73286.1 hypothetical protein NKT35_17355 [Chromobacterium sp. IIBBL 290-4]